jgi:hypothetical protein
MRFSRDLGEVTMDLYNVERVDFKALGGPQTIIVNDFSVSEVTE